MRTDIRHRKEQIFPVLCLFYFWGFLLPQSYLPSFLSALDIVFYFDSFCPSP